MARACMQDHRWLFCPHGWRAGRGAGDSGGAVSTAGTLLQWRQRSLLAVMAVTVHCSPPPLPRVACGSWGRPPRPRRQAPVPGCTGGGTAAAPTRGQDVIDAIDRVHRRCHADRLAAACCQDAACGQQHQAHAQGDRKAQRPAVPRHPACSASYCLQARGQLSSASHQRWQATKAPRPGLSGRQGGPPIINLGPKLPPAPHASACTPPSLPACGSPRGPRRQQRQLRQALAGS